MTREDIIRMARGAGLMPLLDEDCFQTLGVKNFERTKRVLEHFAALVAAAEREACAKASLEQADDWRAELDRNYGDACIDCAAAIRARGQA